MYKLCDWCKCNAGVSGDTQLDTEQMLNNLYFQTTEVNNYNCAKKNNNSRALFGTEPAGRDTLSPAMRVL